MPDNNRQPVNMTKRQTMVAPQIIALSIAR